jgi:protein phosphatase
MGTTLAGLALVLDGEHDLWLAFNIGDSRIYRLSGGRLTQLSVDHSVVQELLDLKEITPAQAATDPRRNVVTRALGGDAVAEVDFWLLPPEAGERFLLCSDGVTGALSDESLERVLVAHADPRDAARAVVIAATEAGTQDDATAVVVDTETAARVDQGHRTATVERAVLDQSDTQRDGARQ